MRKVLKYTLSFLLLLTIVLAFFFTMALLYHPKGKPNSHPEDYIVELQKEKNHEFVILNLTDIQVADLDDFFHFRTIKKEIDELVNQAHPDLITITGDMTWSNENNLAMHFLIRTLDSYKIPWAPVLGNHDLGNDYNSATASGDYLCTLFEESPWCLFKRGPENLGYGNYIIKIMEGDSLYKALFMMENGTKEKIYDEQKNWFLQNMEKIEDQYESFESMVFLHKPLTEYTYAYLDYSQGAHNEIGEVYPYCSLYGVDSNGFFELLKEHHVTDVICGHQHTNCFTLKYQDIRLTFALKTGELSFYYQDENVNLNGGTVIKLDKDQVTILNIMVDPDKYHIKGSSNIYLEE